MNDLFMIAFFFTIFAVLFSFALTLRFRAHPDAGPVTSDAPILFKEGDDVKILKGKFRGINGKVHVLSAKKSKVKKTDGSFVPPEDGLGVLNTSLTHDY